jgi:hypothetical protein
MRGPGYDRGVSRLRLVVPPRRAPTLPWPLPGWGTGELSPTWGWRWMARGYVGVALFAAFVAVIFLDRSDERPPVSMGLAWMGRNGPAGRVVLVDVENAPRVDPESGIVVLPLCDGSSHWSEFNVGVRLRLASGESCGPRFRDRTVDAARIAREFDRHAGLDVGDGTAPFAVGDLRVRIEDYDCNGCSMGVPETLRISGQEVPVARRVLRVHDASDRRRRRPLSPPMSRSVSWFPHMASMRVLVGDEGRTQWCRGQDVDGGRWIVSVDLLTGTTLQIDADPAR